MGSTFPDSVDIETMISLPQILNQLQPSQNTIDFNRFEDLNRHVYHRLLDKTSTTTAK